MVLTMVMAMTRRPDQLTKRTVKRSIVKMGTVKKVMARRATVKRAVRKKVS